MYLCSKCVPAGRSGGFHHALSSAGGPRDGPPGPPRPGRCPRPTAAAMAHGGTGAGHRCLRDRPLRCPRNAPAAALLCWKGKIRIFAGHGSC